MENSTPPPAGRGTSAPLSMPEWHETIMTGFPEWERMSRAGATDEEILVLLTQAVRRCGELLQAIKHGQGARTDQLGGDAPPKLIKPGS